MAIQDMNPLPLTVEEHIELELLLRQEDIDKGVNSFYSFCQLKSPDYYTLDKEYLKNLCITLQNFYERKLIKPDGGYYTKLMINVPPQHGKSRTLVNFCQWVLGKNQRERIIECSYNDSMAADFAKYTRDGIQEERQTIDGYVFSDFFPNVKTKYGSESYHKWALEGQHFNYIGAGVKGSITGKGGTIRVIDDPVKSADEAFNEQHLESIWDWYTGTFLSRSDAEAKGEPLDVIVMTRWAAKDLCGRVLESSDAKNWYQIKLQACNEDTGEMLKGSTLTKSAYETLKSLMQPEIFHANYQQETIERTGLLYKSFKTYSDFPKDEKGNVVFEQVRNYTDTADEGSDYLCSINYGVYKGEAYVLDVLYTKDGMEVTEPLTAQFLFTSNVNEAKIESNNGGRGFARNVERLLWENHKTRSTVIKWFHQSENKVARILSNSSFVQEHIYFPVNWKDRFPEFYRSMTTYLKEGKSKNDDAQDAITGVAETLNQSSGFYSIANRVIS